MGFKIDLDFLKQKDVDVTNPGDMPDLNAGYRMTVVAPSMVNTYTTARYLVWDKQGDIVGEMLPEWNDEYRGHTYRKK